MSKASELIKKYDSIIPEGRRSKMRCTNIKDILDRTVIIHYTGCSDTSSMASARISLFLARLFNLPIIDRESYFSNGTAGKYEIAIIVNSPYAFCHFREYLELYIQKRFKYIIWIQNDFNISVEPKKELKDYVLWTTVPSKIRNEMDAYIDWNKLTYVEQPLPTKTEIEGLIYFGAYRPGRGNYFTKYFTSDAFPLYVSPSSSRQAPKFKALNDKINILGKLPSVTDEIRKYSASLYMEDAFSHKTYCSPANRFYECLGAGVPILFDTNCIKTFETAGYDISPYVVNDWQDIATLLSKSDEIRIEQSKWRRDYRAELVSQIMPELQKSMEYIMENIEFDGGIFTEVPVLVTTEAVVSETKTIEKEVVPSIENKVELTNVLYELKAGVAIPDKVEPKPKSYVPILRKGFKKKIGIIGNLNSPYNKNYPMYRGDMQLFKWLHDHGYDLVQILPQHSPTMYRKSTDPNYMPLFHDWYQKGWVRILGGENDEMYLDEMPTCDAYWVEIVPWWGMYTRFFRPNEYLEKILPQGKPVICRCGDDDWIDTTRKTYFNEFWIKQGFKKYLTGYLTVYSDVSEHKARLGPDGPPVYYLPQCYDEFWEEPIKPMGDELAFVGPIAQRDNLVRMLKKVIPLPQVKKCSLYGRSYSEKFYRLNSFIWEDALKQVFPDKVDVIQERWFKDMKGYHALWNNAFCGFHDNGNHFYENWKTAPNSPYHTPRLYEALWAGHPAMSSTFDDDDPIFTNQDEVIRRTIEDSEGLTRDQRKVALTKWNVETFGPIVEKLLNGERP